MKLINAGVPFSAAVVKNPPNNLWIIAAVLAPIAVVTVIIIIITAVLCRKNKNDFKPDTMMNLPQRAKVSGPALHPKACCDSWIDAVEVWNWKGCCSQSGPAHL